LEGAPGAGARVIIDSSNLVIDAPRVVLVLAVLVGIIYGEAIARTIRRKKND